MPRHVDLTANVQRTPEEKVRIMYSLDQIDSVIDGYPELDNRLYVPEGMAIPSRPSVILGREVMIYDIPGGHDATDSSYRTQTIRNMRPEDLLFGAPDPDMPTGGSWTLAETDPTVRRAIRERCRDFTQHLQPLVPGWRELLALQMPDGRGLGMPTGIGWYTHYWLSKMSDGVAMRLSKNQEDIEVLLYERPGDNQSELVLATPGGYVVRADTQVPDMTPLQAATARRTEYWAERDVRRYGGVPLRVKYPISSGNTLVAGLETTPYARFIHDADYDDDPIFVPSAQRLERAAGYVSLRALCEYNPTGGSSGKNHGENPYAIWTTHFEYVTAGLEAILDPENQFRLGMNAEQFSAVQAIGEDLQSQYPMLQAA